MYVQRSSARFIECPQRLVTNFLLAVLVAFITLIATGSISYADGITVDLAVTKTGNGVGKIASTPSGIDCGSDCSELYPQDTGVMLTATAAPGSTFTGWQGACVGVNTLCALTMNASAQVTATFTLNQYSLTVTKVGNGAGTVASTPTGIDCGSDCTEFYTYGASVTLTAAADPGSTFAGWQGACTGTGTVCSISVTAAAAVTAVFTLNQYQLTATKAGNGSGKVSSLPAGIDCGNDCYEFYTHGSIVTLLANADPSSTFAGWVGGCSGANPICFVTVDAAKSVGAIFILNQYTLAIAKSGNGTGKVSSVLSGIDCGNTCSALYPHGTIITLTATAEVGTNFIGWQGACTGATTTCTVTMDGAKEVTAIFSLKQYNLTITKTGNGTGVVTSTPSGIDCGNVCSALHNHGSLVSLTATATVDSTFMGWSGACTGTNVVCTMTVNATTGVTATFALNQYDLVVIKAGNGTGKITSQPTGIDCGSMCSSRYNHGALLVLTAAADASSTFSGWQGACSNSVATCVVTVDAAKALTATFILKQYALTVSKNGNGVGSIVALPAGITCGITCTQPLNHGTVVTLTASAAASSTFTGWQGACTGMNLFCAVTMDAAKEVTATFTLKQYALTVGKNGNGIGSVASVPAGINCGLTCSQNLNHGTQITLTATAEANSTFTGWQGACIGVLSACEVSIDAAKQVTATFTLKRYVISVAANGNGSGNVTSTPIGITCGITCTVGFNHGTGITLTAAPDPNAIFTGWQGACSNKTGLCVVAVDASKAVTATFTLRPFQNLNYPRSHTKLHEEKTKLRVSLCDFVDSYFLEITLNNTS